MDDQLLVIFQRQVEAQCRIAFGAIEDIGGSFPWGGVQNLVNAAANISKLCWGSGGKAAARRAELRRSLNIAEDSPLRMTRMRNHWEHLDERIDEWWRTSSSRTYIDMSQVPQSMIRGFAKKDCFRNLDESGRGRVLTFWGETYDLVAIIEEIWRIYPVVQAEVAKVPH